jgi:hypothetical protein
MKPNDPVLVARETTADFRTNTPLWVDPDNRDIWVRVVPATRPVPMAPQAEE